MPQKEKITRELSLEKRAIITGFQPKPVTANLNVLINAHAGAFMYANNSSQLIAFLLPVTNTTNGMVFTFFNANTGGVHLVADTNTLIVPAVSQNASHGLKSVNIAPNRLAGVGARVFSTGSYFYVWGQVASNAAAPFTEG